MKEVPSPVAAAVANLLPSMDEGVVARYARDDIRADIAQEAVLDITLALANIALSSPTLGALVASHPSVLALAHAVLQDAMARRAAAARIAGCA